MATERNSRVITINDDDENIVTPVNTSKTYTAQIECNNCGFEGVAELVTGVTVTSNKCPKCCCQYVLCAVNAVQQRKEIESQRRQIQQQQQQQPSAVPPWRAIREQSARLELPAQLETPEWLRNAVRRMESHHGINDTYYNNFRLARGVESARDSMANSDAANTPTFVVDSLSGVPDAAIDPDADNATAG